MYSVVYFTFVETKGRSLEQIDAVFGDVNHAEALSEKPPQPQVQEKVKDDAA